METLFTDYAEYIAGAVALLGGAGAWAFFRKNKTHPTAAAGTKPTTTFPTQATPSASEEPAGFRAGLQRTRDAFQGKLKGLFDRGTAPGTSIWDELEEILLSADVGVRTTQALLDRVRAKQTEAEASAIRTALQSEMIALLTLPSTGSSDAPASPKVISFVGVNGVGKTTTVGKLAARLRDEGKSVLLGAVDTFRAAASQQLQVWAERSGAQFVTGREGGDPGAVAFDAVTAGKARGMDYVLLDTAGRLHTKTNLMDELTRVHRVVKKVIPDAPHEVWLVIDGTLGQNSVRQAEEFKRTLGVTGVIVTKLDGTAKGGAVLAITHDLGLPVKYVGLGEKAADLQPFQAELFVPALFG